MFLFFATSKIFAISLFSLKTSSKFLEDSTIKFILLSTNSLPNFNMYVSAITEDKTFSSKLFCSKFLYSKTPFNLSPITKISLLSKIFTKIIGLFIKVKVSSILILECSIIPFFLEAFIIILLPFVNLKLFKTVGAEALKIGTFQSALLKVKFRLGPKIFPVSFFLLFPPL